ncbi:ChuX/HutX family heme-like substrate-binding protein [Chromobacterium vaccinii]|uniref:ChuX/HutX family heme-like substrate-binding protein n=1 Tax=Chromobacterium vaccinii TaxID=1108595 RepID=UPI000E158AAE|nr:ChuX/HutX family heme-like substrate-binding protein [Chromobacterium vaccinii]SUX54696.1 Hemin transport protein hemS [Chromobacterium vaccinii]
MSQLWDRYQALKASQPKLRARDAAVALGVSECELVAADPAATPLQPEWQAILAALAPLGRVMALTRNHACVHETKGDYANVEFNGKVGLAINPVIDLRIFLFHWRHGFAVRSETPRGVQRSLQFFDRHGEAVHKVYLTADSDVAAYEELAARWNWSRPPRQPPSNPTTPSTATLFRPNGTASATCTPSTPFCAAGRYRAARASVWRRRDRPGACAKTR